jgi:hypothetical protein
MGDRNHNEVRGATVHRTTGTGRPGVVRRVVRWWFDGWLSVPRRALFGPETRALATDAHRLATQLRADYYRWQRARESPRGTLSYAQMLDAWGIDEADVSQTERALRRARWRIGVVWAFAYAALVAEFVLDRFNSWAYLLLAFGCVLVLGVNTLVLSWRLHCLCVRRYQEFPAWLGACLPSFSRSVR